MIEVLLYQTDRTPIASQPVAFSTEVSLDNSTIFNFTRSISTDVQGSARFILSRDLTRNFARILGISLIA
ncbi:MAG: hypothetical protein ACE5OZ_24940 [Candidatus Heimdallarchaeota archaeon]